MRMNDKSNVFHEVATKYPLNWNNPSKVTETEIMDSVARVKAERDSYFEAWENAKQDIEKSNSIIRALNAKIRDLERINAELELKIKEKHQSDSNEDSVNHPSHYCQEGSIECIDEMIMVFGVEAVKWFCILNTWKYRKRAPFKNGIEDIRKSDWYMNKYKELNNQSIKDIAGIIKNL